MIHCTLCEHRCGVNRLAGQTGICRMTMPAVASATLHPAPPESYTVFMAGCNYKCLNCQNWTIAQLPDNGYLPRGFVSAKELAKECVDHLESPAAKLMGADRIFFSGGEPTIHLPYIEKVIAEARKLSPGLKVNKINEAEIEPLCGFIADIDADLPVRFLAFRPNYVLENHPGAKAELMDRCANIAKKSALRNAHWSGQTGIAGFIVLSEIPTIKAITGKRG